jgi:Transglycosylase-like domain
MTDRARQERRQRQARRRQARRRRVVALTALALLLVMLVGTQAPAEATSPSGEASAAATEAEAAASTEEQEGCPEGEVEVEPEAEGEEGEEGEVKCEPEPEPEEEPEEATEGAAPPAVEAAQPQSQPEQATEGGGRQSGAVAGSSLAAPHHRHPGAGSKHAPSGGTAPSASPHRRHRVHRGGPSRSGGTRSGAGPSQPRNWSWSGPWAIPSQIVACESGGNYGALNPSSGAGGAYQILPSTWREYGGSGEPQNAPPAEQDRIAARIWADSGPAAWVCAQNGNWIGARLAGSFSPGSLGPLPDPLPPARRLDPTFMARLVRTARTEHVGWALLLADVRLRGGRGPVPASAVELRRVAVGAAALGGGSLRTRARRLFARRAASQRLVALTYYDRAVGRRGLVEGLEAVKGALEKRVLRSRRLEIYPGGRSDIASGRIDVRVLALLLYLTQRYRSVTVSCLISGHSFYTASGNPSLHAFGRAVDIAALNGTPILGHQQPGGLTERALRLILLLPREMQPSELISLFELGGPSFALADHADHIHVGF